MSLNFPASPTAPDLNQPDSFNQRVLDMFMWCAITMPGYLQGLTAEDFFQVQSGPEDSETGKLLKVGSCLLTGGNVASISDLDQLSGFGARRFPATAANRPPGMNEGVVAMLGQRDDARRVQLAFDAGARNHLAMRGQDAVDGSWRDWAEVLLKGHGIDGTDIGATDPAVGRFYSGEIVAAFPRIDFTDLDAPEAHSVTRVVHSQSSFDFRSYNRSKDLVSVDYRISKDANGANAHGWWITGVEKLTLNDQGNLDLDSGKMVLDGAEIGAAELNIGDDGVGEFTPPRTGGFAFITCGGTSSSVFPSHNFSALIWYDTGGSLTCQKGPAWGSVGQDVDVTISDLTGTSGVDGRVTIAARAGKLKVENRIGAAKTFSVSFL